MSTSTVTKSNYHSIVQKAKESHAKAKMKLSALQTKKSKQGVLKRQIKQLINSPMHQLYSSQTFGVASDEAAENQGGNFARQEARAYLSEAMGSDTMDFPEDIQETATNRLTESCNLLTKDHSRVTTDSLSVPVSPLLKKVSSVWENAPITERSFFAEESEEQSEVSTPPVAEECDTSILVLDNRGTEQRFKVLRYIAEGSYGKVYLVMHLSTHMIYCLKLIPKVGMEKQEITQLIRQMKIQSFVDHPNIVNLYNIFFDENYVYLLLEPCLDGSLFTRMQEGLLAEKQAKKYVYDVSKGVEYLHKHDILHRDIKPENILIHQGTAKVCDFGWAVHSAVMRQTTCGTPLYASPELVETGSYDSKVDIWSIGVLTYELLYGEPPFRICTMAELPRIVSEEVFFPERKDLSQFVLDFMQQCLQKESRKRPAIRVLLLHQFFTSSKSRLTLM